MYTELQIGNETYKLRLTTRQVVELEKKLGGNPLNMFMKIDEDVLPAVTDMVWVLHIALQAFHHGITIEKTYDLLDEYLEEHTVWDLIPVIMTMFKDCGFVERDLDDIPKN